MDGLLKIYTFKKNGTKNILFYKQKLYYLNYIENVTYHHLSHDKKAVDGQTEKEIFFIILQK